MILILGSLWPSLIVEPELERRMYPLSDHMSRYLEESGYMHIQASKPDTIGKYYYC
jgi:juvenile hormone epoxide hydrolase